MDETPIQNYTLIAKPSWLSAFVAMGAREEIFVGADHLLLLRRNVYTESQRRFYFRDIHALTVKGTNQQSVNTILFGLLALLFILLSAFSMYAIQGVAGTVFAIIGGLASIPFVLGFILNLAEGSSCECRIHTAVQSEDIWPLRRLAAARCFVERVTPYIEQAQGTADKDELFEAARSRPSQKHEPLPSHGAPIKSISGRLHASLYIILILSALLGFAYVVVYHPVIETVAMLLMLLMVGVNVAAIVQQRNSDLSRGLRYLTFGALIFTGLTFFISFYAGMVIVMLEATFDPEEISQHPMVTALTIGGGIVELIIGITGLTLLQQWKTERDMMVAAEEFEDSRNGEPQP